MGRWPMPERFKFKGEKGATTWLTGWGGCLL